MKPIYFVFFCRFQNFQLKMIEEDNYDKFATLERLKICKRSEENSRILKIKKKTVAKKFIGNSQLQ